MVSLKEDVSKVDIGMLVLYFIGFQNVEKVS